MNVYYHALKYLQCPCTKCRVEFARALEEHLRKTPEWKLNLVFVCMGKFAVPVRELPKLVERDPLIAEAVAKIYARGELRCRKH